MALQDDIFDVEEALKGKAEAEAFDRIQDHLNRVEVRNREMRAIIDGLQIGMKAFDLLKRWDK